MDGRSINNIIEETESGNKGTGLRLALSAFAKRHKGFCIFSGFFLFSVVINIIARYSEGFAEWMARYIVPIYNTLVGTISGFFGFSLAELAVLMIFPAFVASVFHCFHRDVEKTSAFASVKKEICIVLAVASVFMLTSVCYYRKPLAESLGMERKSPEIQELLDAMDVCSAKLVELDADIAFDSDGLSRSELSYDELADILLSSYASMDYDCLPYMDILPKPLSLSKPMAYLQTSGIFVFLTGEAHYNTAYPDFVTVYSMAHEMAHQRGFMREDEASFLGFLACVNSNNSFVRRAGYLSMLNTLANAALRIDEEATLSATARLPATAINELYGYGQYMLRYESEFFNILGNALNHFYLKTQQQAQGIQSYSLVVELATTWLLEQ